MAMLASQSVSLSVQSGSNNMKLSLDVKQIMKNALPLLLFLFTVKQNSQ